MATTTNECVPECRYCGSPDAAEDTCDCESAVAMRDAYVEQPDVTPVVEFAATDGRGAEHRANDPNEAGALAREATPKMRRDVLVCAVKRTSDGNEYQVPVGWFSRSMHETWRGR